MSRYSHGYANRMSRTGRMAKWSRGRMERARQLRAARRRLGKGRRR